MAPMLTNFTPSWKEIRHLSKAAKAQLAEFARGHQYLAETSQDDQRKRINQHSGFYFFVFRIMKSAALFVLLLPCQATTGAPLPRRRGSGPGCSSCPSWALPRGWWSLARCRTRPRPATGARVTSIQTHAHATALSRALREEGELVCNKVTPVG